VYDIEQIDHPELGIEIHLTIATERFAALKDRRRTLAGRTGCGLCGIDSLTAFESALPANVQQQSFAINREALLQAFDTLKAKQTINSMTGAMHAAALVDRNGQIVMVREDLGRHNALDKLIGATLGTDVSNHGVIMTSRASYELAQKTARAGFALLATISAPTSLAIRLAQQSGLTLIGFVRNNSFVAYSHPERLTVQ
jgi:formate dehydrogenase accessory protein FdhD